MADPACAPATTAAELWPRTWTNARLKRIHLHKNHRDDNRKDGGRRPEWVVTYNQGPEPVTLLVHAWKMLGPSWSASNAQGHYSETDGPVMVLPIPGEPPVSLL